MLRSHMNEEEIKAEVLKLLDGVPLENTRDQSYFFKETLPALATSGLLGMLIPQESGGAGLKVQQYVAVLMEIAKRDLVSGYVINEHSTLGSLPLLYYGNPEQKGRYLEKVANGRILAAFGLTEPGSGSNAAEMKSQYWEASEAFILNGKKLHISLASYANLYTIFAARKNAGAEKQFSAFFLEKGMKDLSFGNEEDFMPKGNIVPCVGAVVFKGCQVPKSNLLGREGQGIKIALSVLDVARLGLAAVYVGGAQTTFAKALDRAGRRRQFGSAIIDFQAISFNLAEMAIKQECARLLVNSAARLLNEGKRATKECAMAKVYATDTATFIGEQLVNIYSASSYLHDPPLDQFWRDSKMGQMMGGTPEIMKLIIAREITHEKKTTSGAPHRE